MTSVKTPVYLTNQIDKVLERAVGSWVRSVVSEQIHDAVIPVTRVYARLRWEFGQ